jgi:hypothetical protein
MLSEASYHNMTVGRIPSVEGGIQPTIVDAKGDLIVATGNDSPNRLAVGANDTVLTADSTAGTGLKWASPLPSQTGQSGNYLTTNGTTASWGAVSAVPASATATVATSQTSTATSYSDLATAGPAVTVTTGTKALVIVTALISDNTSGRQTFVDFAVSGATTRAATDNTALLFEQTGGSNNQELRASTSTIVTLTAGSNTFTAKYKTSGSTSTFANREIIVINLG